jgi:hypothetical protein
MSAGWMDKFLYRLSRKGEIPWLTLSRGKVVGTVTVLIYDPDGNRILSRGTTVPSAAAGYAKGALFLKTNAGNGVQALYENIGTTASCSFSLVGSIVPAEIALPEGNLLIGNNVGAAVALDGKASGVIPIGNGTTMTMNAITGVISLSTAGLTAFVANSVANAALAAMAAGSVKVGNAAGTAAIDLSLAINTVLSNDGTSLVALSLPRKSLLTGGATTLQAVAVAAGDVVTANANDIAVYSLAQKALLVNKGAGLTGQTVAVGDIVTAGATDIAVVSIAAGEMVVGTATGIDGVALADGDLAIGTSAGPIAALNLGDGDILYFNGTDLAALALPALSILITDSVTGLLKALTGVTGSLFIGGATDVEVLNLAAGQMLIGSATGAVVIDVKGDAKLLIGNGTTAAMQSVTGDITITNAGLVAIASGVIVDADVNASAAIAGSKIKPFFNTAVSLFGAAATVNTAGPAQFSPAEILGLALMRDCAGAHRADTLPDADDLVAAITGAYVGQSFYITVVNTSAGAFNSSITGGTNGSVIPTAPPAVAQDKAITFLIVLTNVTPAAEAYSAYVVGALD